MKRIFLVLALVLVLLGCCGRSYADSVAIGILSYDPYTGFGTPSQIDIFDISNSTGLSSAPPLFPVTTSLTFDNLTLTVTNADSSMSTYLEGSAGEGPTFFFDTQVLDSLSPLGAVLAGTISPTTITLSDGSTVNIAGDFTTVLAPSGTSLAAATDFAFIYATTQGVPEPSSLLLLGFGLAVVVGVSWKRLLQ